MRDTKANIGSLSSQAHKVRQEKKDSASSKKAPLSRAREPAMSFKSADASEDSSSDSDSSSNSDSNSDASLAAARAKLFAKKAAKNEAVDAKVNGATKSVSNPAKPAAKKGASTSAQKSDGGSKLESESESGTESESDSESETSSSDSPASKPVAIPSRPKSAVSEPESDTSSEGTSSSTSSSESEEVTANKKVVNGKPSAIKKSDESDSSSDEDEETTSQSAQGKAMVKSGPESSAEESDSSSDSDDEGDSGKSTLSKTNGTVVAAESTSQLSRAPWLNNSEFTLRKASSDNPGKEVADFFNSANLEGKQVWYFTAPASLPITVLKDMEIDLTKAMKGGPLLTHAGDNYGLDLESHATNTQIQLLIPSRGGDKYTALNHSIDSTVHLRRMAKFGPGGEVHATATDDYVPVPKPIREQPEGLRIRYTPIGVPSIPSANAAKLMTPANSFSSQPSTKLRVPSRAKGESESDSDVEMTAPPAPAATKGQKKSAKVDVANGDRKRKHPGDEDQGAKRLKAGQVTKESSPKKRTPIHPPNVAAASNATPSKQSSQEVKAKKEKSKKDKTPKPAVVTPIVPKQTPIPLPNYPGMKH
ncbi:DNA-directed RNA polymerase I subunit RPA34.5-domain-containing protein [Xylaria intraflava]|nr:DNA-directed RNA polymerase I subunit RPA34.5-domain-containing protein [Xylaria intraflava]